MTAGVNPAAAGCHEVVSAAGVQRPAGEITRFKSAVVHDGLADTDGEWQAGRNAGRVGDQQVRRVNTGRQTVRRRRQADRHGCLRATRQSAAGW